MPIGVPSIPPPAIEGTIPLSGKRRLGYAEFGVASGPLVLWFHGSPGARRQIPVPARQAAASLGLRLVCVERPGIGDSTDHAYRVLIDWAADVAVVADTLGHDRFMVAGLSGGGPYAMATAHALPSRVVAVGLLGSLVPTAGPEAAAGGLVQLAHTFNGPIGLFRRPLGVGMWAMIRATNPLSHAMTQGFGRLMPEGDRRVMQDPDTEAMFVDDLTVGSKRQFQAFVNDFVLIGRDWGFRVGEIKVPVRWWHGDADPFVSLEAAQRTAARLADVELYVRPGEGHLGDFAAADETLESLAKLWEARAR